MRSSAGAGSSGGGGGGRSGAGSLFDDRVFVFVGGMQGSGATRVDRLLSSQALATGFRPRSTSVPNTKGCTYPIANDAHRCHAPENEGVFLTKVFDNFLHKESSDRCTMPIWGMCANQERLFASDVKKAGGVHFRHQLLEEWGPWWNTSKPYLIEKDVANMVKSLFLQELMGVEHSAFIFTLRHPLANCRDLRCDVTGTIEAWLKVHEYWIQDVHLLDHHVAFHYDAFLHEPEEVAAAVKRLLGWSNVRYIDKSKVKSEKIVFAPILEQSSKEFMKRRNKKQQLEASRRRKADRGRGVNPNPLAPRPVSDAPDQPSKPIPLVPSGSVWDQVDVRLRDAGLVSAPSRGSPGRRLEAVPGAREEEEGSSSRGSGGMLSWLKGKMNTDSATAGPVGLCMDEGIEEVVVQLPFDMRAWVDKYPTALSAEQKQTLSHFEERLNAFCYSLDSLMPQSSLCSKTQAARQGSSSVIFSASYGKAPLQIKKSYFEASCPRANATVRPYMQKGSVNFTPHRVVDMSGPDVTGKAKRFSVIVAPGSYNYTRPSNFTADLPIVSSGVSGDRVITRAHNGEARAINGRSPLTGTLHVRPPGGAGGRGSARSDVMLQGSTPREYTSRRLAAAVAAVPNRIAGDKANLTYVATSMYSIELASVVLVTIAVILAIVLRRRHARNSDQH